VQLSNNNYRKSKQRTQILEILKNTNIHPTAIWIYDKLKSEFPNLSLGTVYRNLSILNEQGLILKIKNGSTFDRFDAHISPHYHLICEECGSITDLDIDINDIINEIAIKVTPFIIKHHKIDFFGTCQICKNKKNL